MLLQEAMIERLREVCRQDERLAAAVLYGSFTTGEGDAYSDVEAVLFFVDVRLPHVDRQAWVGQIAPVQLFFRDEWGHYTAIFDNLVRGEFHFEPAAEMKKVETWAGSSVFPSAASCILADKTGELAQHIRPLLNPPGDRGAEGQAAALLQNLANMALYGGNVLARGEAARALEILNIAHRHLLWLVRLGEGQTAHWPSPTKGLERDLAPVAYARYGTCCAGLDIAGLWRAYQATWQWACELAAALAGRYDMGVPQPLIERISERLVCLHGRVGS
jgi:lincosamide nucleotidyltransferase B/F